MTAAVRMASTALADDRGLQARRPTRRQEWNALVEGFADADFKQAFEWGELRREEGWRPVRVAVVEDGVCGAVCSLGERRWPALGSVMYTARGPLFDAGRPAALHRLVDELRSEARRSRAIVLRCARPASGDDVRALDALHGAGFVTPSRPAAAWVQTQVLDLRPPEEHLWRQVRRRMRDYVGAARRRGLVVEASTRAEDFEAFRHVLANAGRLKGFEVRPAAYYRAVHAAYGDRAVLLVARGDDRVVGGLLALRFGRSAFMLHMSARSDGDVLRHHVAPALYWALVRWAKDAGCDLLDFGPSAVQLPPRESDPGWGVFHFKAGFGAELTTYQPPVDLVFRAAPYRVLRVIERLAVSRPMHLGRRSLTATGDVLRRLRPVAA